MDTQKQMLKIITYSNFVLFFISVVVAFFLSKKVGMGLVAGALIITLNFYISHRHLNKSFNQKKLSPFGVVLAKHYMRFLFTCFVIFLIIASKQVHPLGLLIGLSIVTISIFISIIYELYNNRKRKTLNCLIT